MRTSPPVTEVSGTMREAQNRNTSPSNSCSGEMISIGPTLDSLWQFPTS